jgi:uridine phosphorylase
MNHHDYPILEHDDAAQAFIEPGKLISPIDVAEHCVVCFFQDVISKLIREHKARLVETMRSEMGVHPLHEIIIDGKRLAFFHPGVGAPLAAGLLEEAIAFGCRKFIACGGSGSLKRELTAGHVIVPTSAVRDEGTSYHYLPASREVKPHDDAVKAIEATLQKHNVPFVMGKTWTMDALYRETPTRIARRRDEGCLVVEMEASAFFAVSQFRAATFAQILYAGDDLSSDEWSSRGWTKLTSTREKLFWLAAEACLSL